MHQFIWAINTMSLLFLGAFAYRLSQPRQWRAAAGDRATKPVRVPITSLAELTQPSFVTIRVAKERYLAAVHTASPSQTAPLQMLIWRVSRALGGIQLQCFTGAYLSAAPDGHLSVDRVNARSFETFLPQFSAGAQLSLQSAHQKWLQLDPGVRGLRATAADPAPIFTVARTVDCDSEVACWGERASPRHLNDSQLLPVVLFGSPKEHDKLLAPALWQNQQRVFECWAKLPTLSTLIFTRDLQVSESAERHHLQATASFALHPHFMQPTYKDLFDRAYQLGGMDVVVYTNGDILYTRDLLETITAVHRHAANAQRPPLKFMVVGQRINFDLPEPTFAFGPNWEEQIRAMAKKGELFQANAQDYFVVSAALWREMVVPDFVIGGTAFDNWFTGRAIDRGYFVVDGTATITALHLNHGHPKQSHHEPKSQHNTRLALRHGGWGKGSVTQCRWFTQWDRTSGALVLWDRHAPLLRP